jgi:hypothetical protein
VFQTDPLPVYAFLLSHISEGITPLTFAYWGEMGVSLFFGVSEIKDIEEEKLPSYVLDYWVSLPDISCQSQSSGHQKGKIPRHLTSALAEDLTHPIRKPSGTRPLCLDKNIEDFNQAVSAVRILSK